MQVKARYSHLNGEEYLLVHRKHLWEEVQTVIAEVNAHACRTKVSREKTMQGKTLFSPTDMNQAFKAGLQAQGWSERRNDFWVTADEKLLRGIYGQPESEQRRAIEEAGQTPIKSYNQTDFVKDRVAVEVQFGKYAFVAHDLFVKHVKVAEAVSLSAATVARVRRRFVEEGLEAAINDRPRSGRERKLSGRQEAHLVAIACSNAPEGHTNWTLQLLANRVVAMEFAGSISLETVRQILKKTNSNHGRRKSGASPR